jgi:redox-sensing transcriptional repressor
MKNPDRSTIPRKTVYRLSVYFRCLNRLKNNGIVTVSSEALARAAGVKPTQLRKDLAHFGQFGTRGLGYEVTQLARTISDVLGNHSLQPVILVGVGKLGSALLSYGGFAQEGFEIIAAFDMDSSKQRLRSPLPIYPMEKLAEFIHQRHVRMAILCVPAAVAQEVANQLFAAGIGGVLNFAPIVIHAPDDAIVNHVNLAIELENLSYFIQT